MNFFARALLVLITGRAIIACADDGGLRKQSFDADPHWDALNNRLFPETPPTTKQDFGYSPTDHCGAGKGEIGGAVQRSSLTSWYAKEIPPKTFNDPFEASGKFSVTSAQGMSDVLFGFFSHTSRGWRTPDSLMVRLSGNKNTYWVFYEYGTHQGFCGGEGCFEGKHFQTTPTKPFPADATVHTWSLKYDPDGAGGNGQITFVLDGKTYTRDLTPGHKADGATFDRFGMYGAGTAGNFIQPWLGDLSINGEKQDLSADPRWEARNNRGEFPERLKRPMHDFGYSPTTHAAAGKGEIGGVIWRAGPPAYYADAIGSFTLDDHLHASGKIAFVSAAPDSGAWIGFFNADSKKSAGDIPEKQSGEPNVLAIHIEGPSRVGHYFRPACFNQQSHGVVKESGPIIRPDGTSHTWSLDYDPAGANGDGRITVKFDDDTQTLDLSAKHRKAGANFDHFGIFNGHRGGHFVEIYLDDLQYSAR